MSRFADRGPQPPGQRKQAGDLVVGQLVDELMQFIASGPDRSGVGPHRRAERGMIRSDCIAHVVR